MNAQPYPICQVQKDWVLDDEPMGTKEKFWLETPGDGHTWLFKYSRENDGVVTGEHWAEKVAAELAALLEIPHARVELAEFEGRLGCMSAQFEGLADPAIELVHGNELLAGAADGYDKTQRRGQHKHTLPNILYAVERIMAPEPIRSEAAFRTIGSFVVLDALILNTDRHHENWAVLRESSAGKQVSYRMAPSFDHASSLGRELTHAKLATWEKEQGHIVRYAKKGKGGVFLKEGGRAGANPLVLAEVAFRRWPEYLEPALKRLRDLPLASFLDEIERVPDTCIRERSRQFAANLVEYTYTRLSKLR